MWKIDIRCWARARQGVGEAGQALGAPEFAALLVDAGADARWATAAWTANHLRWVVWKLAALERRHAAALAGRALTAPVVLDQLKYRCAALNPQRLHHHLCSGEDSYEAIIGRSLGFLGFVHTGSKLPALSGGWGT